MLLYPSKPITMLVKSFDPMLYLANWGTKQLVCRLPRSRVDVEALAPYRSLDVTATSLIKNAVLLGYIHG